jgi:class 3 adenylate cyclase
LFNDAFLNRTKRNATYQAALALSASIALHSALVTADSLSPDAVNNAIGFIDEYSAVGRLSFDKQGRIKKEMLSVQIDASGERQIVAPLSSASGEFFYPSPSYELRKCVSDNLCLHGTCQSNGVCSCLAGWEGSNCDTKVHEPELPVGMIVGVVIGGVTSIFLVMLYPQLRASLDRRRAPQGDIVTVLFTDIEGSSDLWCIEPEIMGDVVDRHHEVLRDCIRRHDGYEVKTIGDAFLIACSTPLMGHRIALDIQQRLYDQTWPGFVSSFYDARHPDDSKEVSLWNGLRVRIGVHTGVVQHVEDTVTKRFDYYGSAINLCARVEAAAAGGQILCTTEHYEALGNEKNYANAKLMGEFMFKGISVPTKVTEISSDTFQRRKFPPITTPFSCAHLSPGVTTLETEASNISEFKRSSDKSSTQPSEQAILPVLFSQLVPFHPLVQAGEDESTVAAHIANGLEWINHMTKPLLPRVRRRVIEDIAKAWKVQTGNVTYDCAAIVARAATSTYHSRVQVQNPLQASTDLDNRYGR